MKNKIEMLDDLCGLMIMVSVALFIIVMVTTVWTSDFPIMVYKISVSFFAVGALSSMVLSFLNRNE